MCANVFSGTGNLSRKDQLGSQIGRDLFDSNEAERLDGLRPENLLSLQTHRAKQDPSWLVVPDPKSR